MRTVLVLTGVLVCGAVLAAPALLFAQAPGALSPPAPTVVVQRITVADAVRLALENNLGLQVARLTPQIQDLSVASARAAWVPALGTTLQTTSTDSPNNSFLSGAQGEKTSDDRFTTTVTLGQSLPWWGGSYRASWDGARSTTTNLFSNFSPQLRSSLGLNFRQPLLRDFSIDTPRQQLLVSLKNREISDVGLRQTVATTTRAVRNAYWDLAYAMASLDVQRQSLELARESLRNTRARIEIGTTPPIDVIEAEAEEATREEAVILAESQIQSYEDALRALVYDPDMSDFWTIRIEPSELPTFQPTTVDVDTAIRNAIDRRTDLVQARKTLEANDITIRFLRNQTLPDVSANVDYGLTGLGGTQFIRGTGFPGPVIGQTERSFASVLGDILNNNYPTWTLSLNVSYPLGARQEQANLARARLEYSQLMAQLKSQQLQVASEVREVARQVQTNQKRVESTRTSRLLAERRLDAEQRKLAAGTSTTFFVFQAQRDLAQARNNELRAVLDYSRSVVDLETVQEVPLAAR